MVALFAMLTDGGRFLRRPFWLALPLLLLLAVGFAAWSPEGAAANGRAIRICTQGGTAEPICTHERGPYGVEASILPGRAVVNNTHLSVQALDLSSGTALTTATVLVSATGPADVAGRPAAFGPIAAVNSESPQFFEATLPFAVPGEWALIISIDSELGPETLRLPVTVREGRPINLILVAAIAVAALAVGIWTYDRVRGRRRPANSAG